MRRSASRQADTPTAATALAAAAAAYRRDRLPHRAIVPVSGARRCRGCGDPRSHVGDEDRELLGAARGTAVARAAPVAFVFSGNGSQHVGMGLSAYRHNAVFRAEIDQHLEAAFAERSPAGRSSTRCTPTTSRSRLSRSTQIAQPLLYAIQAADLPRAGARWGSKPDIVLGHSVGEVAAAEAAGILDRAGASEDDLLAQPAPAAHGRAWRHGRGHRLARDHAGDPRRAARSWTIACLQLPARVHRRGRAGESIDGLSAAARRHKARIRKLDLAYPFHSELMAPVEAAAAAQSLARPRASRAASRGGLRLDA